MAFSRRLAGFLTAQRRHALMPGAVPPLQDVVANGAVVMISGHYRESDGTCKRFFVAGTYMLTIVIPSFFWVGRGQGGPSARLAAIRPMSSGTGVTATQAASMVRVSGRAL